MLQQIDSKHLAALEAELARVTAQRDALRDALRRQILITEDEPAAIRARGLSRCCRVEKIARAALQACQD